MQSRIVLRDSVLERGEQLLQTTKLGSLTELISVMFSKYGGHLEQTWEVKPMFPSLTQPELSVEAIASAAALQIAPTSLPAIDENFTFDEPITGL